MDGSGNRFIHMIGRPTKMGSILLSSLAAEATIWF